MSKEKETKEIHAEFSYICEQIYESKYKQLPSCENMVNTFEKKHFERQSLIGFMKGLITMKYTFKGNMDTEVFETLTNCLEYFEDREDADHDGSGYVPNKEMILAEEIRELLSKLEK